MLNSKRKLSVLLTLAIVVALVGYQIFTRQQAKAFITNNAMGSVVYLSHDQAGALQTELKAAGRIKVQTPASQIPLLKEILPKSKSESINTIMMLVLANMIEEKNGPEGVAILIGEQAGYDGAVIYALNRSDGSVQDLAQEYVNVLPVYQEWLQNIAASDPVDNGTWQFADDYGAVCKLGAC
jgi:hypothetical protein